MTTGIDEMNVMANDDFDLMLDDVLHTVANPEVPARVRVRTRVWVQEMPRGETTQPTSRRRDVGHPSPAVFAPDVFLAKMQPKRDKRSTAYALLAHAAAILLVCLAVSAHVRFAPPAANPDLTMLASPPPMAPERRAAGGGGGQNNHTPADKGQLPKFAREQITPPKTPVEAKIRMPDPAIETVTNLKMANPDMPNFGMPNSTNLGASLGQGKGTGIGPGDGPGLGAGRGGNWGGGDVRSVGGGVSEPVVIHEVQPEFSEEARRTKSMGNVLVSLIVDAHGIPQDVHVARSLGMGLDEKAIEAVKQYRFRPAMENGKPVAVYMNVEVIFQIE